MADPHLHRLRPTPTHWECACGRIWTAAASLQAGLAGQATITVRDVSGVEYREVV